MTFWFIWVIITKRLVFNKRDILLKTEVESGRPGTSVENFSDTGGWGNLENYKQIGVSSYLSYLPSIKNAEVLHFKSEKDLGR